MLSRRALCFLSLLVLVAAALLGGGGCGSAAPATATDCHLDPFQCASGTTCDVKACTCLAPDQCTDTTCTPEFACLPSSSSHGLGASCTNQVGAASCGDGLTCIYESGFGTCAQYCDENQPCTQGLSCEPLTIKLGSPASYPIIHVCQVPSLDGSMCLLDGSTCQATEAGSSGGFPDVNIDVHRQDVFHM